MEMPEGWTELSMFLLRTGYRDRFPDNHINESLDLMKEMAEALEEGIEGKDNAKCYRALKKFREWK